MRATDGAVLAEKLGFVAYIGPVVEGRRAYYAGTADWGGSNDRRAQALELPARAEAPFKTVVRWQVKIPGPRVYGTPLVDEGRLIVVDSEGALIALDAATGEEKLRREGIVKGTVFASPVRIGNRLVVTSDSGDVALLDATTFESRASGALDDHVCGTPAPDGTRTYFRGWEGLYGF